MEDSNPGQGDSKTGCGTFTRVKENVSPGRLRPLLEPLAHNPQRAPGIAGLRLQLCPGVVQVCIGLSQQLVLRRGCSGVRE